MGLSEAVGRLAVRGVHLLVVAVPEWPTVRMSLEQAVFARSWRLARSAADADALVVCGRPGAELRGAADRVWAQLPGPRARGVLTTPANADALLDSLAAELLDAGSQRRDARSRTSYAVNAADEDEMTPAGIQLAGEGPDRDGVDLDVLHVPLGPVLPHWPAGLRLDCRLQGDVVVAAQARMLPAAEPEDPTGAPAGDRRRAVMRCDASYRLLAVAGWDAAADSARHVRDQLLTGAPMSDCASRLDRLRRRVERSVSLRWLLRDLPPGDVHRRLVRWLAEAAAAARGERETDPRVAPPGSVTETLPDLVAGLDLGAARLVVAAHEPDSVVSVRESAHG